MKILVFDDNENNRIAAQEQLKDHDLTVVGTYNEAQKLLTPQFDYEKANATIKAEFGDFNPYNSEDKTKKVVDYFAAKKVAREQATTYPNFDVVLSDLLVPPSMRRHEGSREEFVGKEMSVGIFIGLLAAVKARAKYVAVFTDSDHHCHPASACFDAFNDDNEWEPTAFTIEDSKVLLVNNRNWVIRLDSNSLDRNGPRIKNWAAVLTYLTA